MFNNKRSPEAQKRRDERREQKREAYHIRNDFGKFYDYINAETIQCQTPEEVHYYLNITFPDGVYECAIPESTIQGLVLTQKLSYQIQTDA